MNKVIGLCGYAGAGKDYVYGLLREFFGYATVKRYALADEVRREAAREVLNATGSSGLVLAHAPRKDLGVWQKPYTPAQRALLQWWGTEFRRSQDPDYWVDLMAAKLQEESDDWPLQVVTDVRFENEATMIRSLGGLVVEVEAVADIRQSRLGGALPPAHASEVIDFEVDGKVTNNERTVMSIEVADYLGLPVHCTKCRTFYREHPWHDDGTWNEESGLSFETPAAHLG